MIWLTDEQWERIRKHFPEEHIPDGRAGRKPIPTRHVLEAVLWVLNTGAQWHMLPQSYPNYKTVHRRFQTWCCNEILRLVLTDVANELRDNGALVRWVPLVLQECRELGRRWRRVPRLSNNTFRIETVTSTDDGTVREARTAIKPVLFRSRRNFYRRCISGNERRPLTRL